MLYILTILVIIFFNPVVIFGFFPHFFTVTCRGILNELILKEQLKNAKICVKSEENENIILISKLGNSENLSYLTKPGFTISREYYDDNFQMNNGIEVKDFILDTFNPYIITKFIISEKV